ncbi:60S ribosomal protein L34 [Pycnococcus provasolii]|uniref:60S ribosomal protein L34 n=1 Tax=Pycnococcus provasolii TaxID=41880 RepID=A0A830H9J3_9CHLO|nr:60S ribosomal protein L34 [Pycnococcus provasolii]
MVQRLTYRRRKSYATRSNKTRVLRTPGGQLQIQYTKKRVSGPKCAKSGQVIHGVKHVRPWEMSKNRMNKKEKTVHRAYGGCLSHGVVRDRVVRAFLTEEAKIVKKVQKLAAKADKKK